MSLRTDGMRPYYGMADAPQKPPSGPARARGGTKRDAQQYEKEAENV